MLVKGQVEAGVRRPGCEADVTEQGWGFRDQIVTWSFRQKARKVLRG